MRSGCWKWPIPPSTGSRCIRHRLPASTCWRWRVITCRLPPGRFQHRNFVFPIALAAGSRAVFFLRVSSQGSLTLPLNVWRQDVFEQHGRSSYALLSLYYGMLLALAAYNLLLYVSLREPIYLLYVAFVTSMAVGQLSLNGLGNQYLWPAWPEWGNLALLVGFSATGLFGALFTRKFLETRRLPGWDWLVLTLAGGFALAVLAAMLAPYREVAMATSLATAYPSRAWPWWRRFWPCVAAITGRATSFSPGSSCSSVWP